MGSAIGLLAPASPWTCDVTLCADIMMATTSLGKRSFSAPFSSWWRLSSYMPSADWNLTIKHMSVYTWGKFFMILTDLGLGSQHFSPGSVVRGLCCAFPWVHWFCKGWRVQRQRRCVVSFINLNVYLHHLVILLKSWRFRFGKSMIGTWDSGFLISF